MSRQPSKPSEPHSGKSHTQAAIDLAAILAVFTLCALTVPYLNPRLRAAHGFAFLLATALYQFCAEGLAPLTLMLLRRQSFADYGYTWQRIRFSLLVGFLLAIVYDAAISLHAHAPMWIPLRRQPSVRIALASSVPLLVLGLVITVALWGFLEGFFGIYFASKINVLCKHSGRGWLAPGVLAFALFNGGIHLIVGQGLEGFITSFASGYAIAVVPAVTGNAWGGSLVQTLTNAVSTLRR